MLIRLEQIIVKVLVEKHHAQLGFMRARYELLAAVGVGAFVMLFLSVLKVDILWHAELRWHFPKCCHCKEAWRGHGGF